MLNRNMNSQETDTKGHINIGIVGDQILDR